MCVRACPTATVSNDTYTSSDIEEYQLVLWTSVSLVAILAATLCLLLNMDSRHDPVLYSQFKGTRDIKRD